MAPPNESRSFGLGSILIVVLVAVMIAGAFLVRFLGDAGPPPAPAASDTARQSAITENASGGRLEAANTAPDFNLADLDGNQVRLSDYVGRPVLINFWATWCGPCEIEMPIIEDAYQAHQSDGLAVLAVAVDDDPESVRGFFAERELTFLPLLDDGSVSSTYQVFGLPTSYFVSADGRIVAVHMGLLTEDRIEEYLAQTHTGGAQ
jgi:thiol-disulfide isomerase/thioredoxin